jgi:ABC-type phosphate/phosphonate transport system substrate-binding protein
MNALPAAFASLPMYELPPLAPAWDRFWALTRAELSKRGIDAAETLRRVEPYSQSWRDPELLIGQTCGWPLVSQLCDAVVPFARFDFGLDTKRPGDYFSVFIGPRASVPAVALRPADLAPLLADPDTRIAVNSFASQSGFRALGECLAEPMTVNRDRLVMTGSHINSIRAVAAGQADLAAIDAATWQLALEHEPAARQVSVVARSTDAPGLPLIASARHGEKASLLLECLTSAVRNLAAADRAALHLSGVVPARREDYEVLKRPPFGNLRSEKASKSGSM